jgi:hypothetical protein
MDEKPDQIMSHIETQRDQLGRNLNELESRVKSAADWRVQFNKNPMLMMGVALGGGMLLGSMVGGSRRSGRSSWSSSSRNYATAGASMAAWGGGSGSTSSSSSSPAKSSYTSTSSPAVREQRRKANETLDNIKAALIGFATAKVKEFMTEALPGFHQHLDEAHKHGQGSSQYGSPGGTGSSDFSSGFEDGRESGSRTGSSSQGNQGNTSYGNQANTRTEHSANSPYTNQGAGENRGVNI